jgi:hypothetical protein
MRYFFKTPFLRREVDFVFDILLKSETFLDCRLRKLSNIKDQTIKGQFLEHISNYLSLLFFRILFNSCVYHPSEKAKKEIKLRILNTLF